MTLLVLLGAGHAHLQVLRAFAAEPLRGARALLVTPAPTQLYSGMLPGMLAGHYEAAEGTIDVAPLAVRAGVELILGAASALDASARRVRLADGRELGYDLLSLDIGSTPDLDAIRGAREHGLFVRPLADFAQRLGARLQRTPPGRALVVVGGGAAGFELALALRWRMRCPVVLVSGAAGPLAGYPPGVRRLGRAALARHGVAWRSQDCRALHAQAVELDTGELLPCGAALVATAGGAPRWLGASGLALDAQGFVATGPTLQSVSHGEVFAAGDVASRADAVRPRSGVHAVRAGVPLAANLRRRCADRAARLPAHRPQRRSLNLLACGERRAIAAWGPWAVEGAWAWRWKDRIDRAFVASFGAPPGGSA